MTDYIIFDIETVVREIPPAIAEAKMKKLRNRFVKEDVIQENFEEWKSDTWAFQPGGSKPIAIGVGIEGVDGVLFEAMASDDEVELATWFLKILKTFPLHKLVGFNVKKFDLPQLMVSMAKANVAINQRYGRYDVIDLMKEPYGHDVGMFSLDYYATIFGLPTHEEDGSMVAGMWEEDKKDGGTRVKDYCLKDVQLTKSLFDVFRLFHKF
jgi:hypothetical protein